MQTDKELIDKDIINEMIENKVTFMEEKWKIQERSRENLKQLNQERIKYETKRNQILNSILLDETDEKKKNAINSLLSSNITEIKDVQFRVIRNILLLTVSSYFVFVLIGLLRANYKILSGILSNNSVLENLVISSFWIGIFIFSLTLFLFGAHKAILNTSIFSLKLEYIIVSLFMGTVFHYYSKDNVNINFSGSVLSDLLDSLFYFSGIMLLIYVITILVRLYRYEENENSLVLSNTIPTLSSDKPISSYDEDRFNRLDFAKRIADMIDNNYSSDSITIGIYGEWGSGKSSVFNMVKNYLNEESIVFEYKPWYFGTDNQDIIKNFLVQLSKEFKKNLGFNNEIAKDIVSYASYLAAISFRPPGAVFSVKDFLDKIDMKGDSISLSDLRSKLENNLINSKQKVVVFIDDIDRLDVSEIQMVFKLVRLVADFPNITYLLALDEKNVSIALGGIYTNEQDECESIGRKYLEKFIQIPLYLPKHDHIKNLELCWFEIEKIYNIHKLPLKVTREDFFLKTTKINVSPRNSKRYLNALHFFVPLLGKNVNQNDLIYILLIKILSPSVYDYIANNPSDFLEKNSEVSGNVEDLTPVKDLINELFPYYYSQTKPSDTIVEKWNNEKRICSPKHFHRYFMYSVPDRELSQKEFDKFLSKIENANEDKCYDYYDNLISTYQVWEVNTKIALELVDISEVTKLKIFEVLIKKFNRDNKDMNEAYDYLYILPLLFDITRDINIKILETSIGKVSNLFLKVRILNELLRIVQDEPGKQTITDTIKNSYITAIESERYFLKGYNQYEASYIIENWSKFFDYKVIKGTNYLLINSQDDFLFYVGCLRNENFEVHDDKSLLVFYISIIRTFQLEKALDYLGDHSYPHTIQEYLKVEREWPNHLYNLLLFGYAHNRIYNYILEAIKYGVSDFIMECIHYLLEHGDDGRMQAINSHLDMLVSNIDSNQ